LAYVLSFVYLGIYWNNHHHMLQAVTRVSGVALWANLHLLFWLSLVPFVTAWMSGSGFPTIPVAVYGMVLLAAGFAYFALERILLHVEGEGSLFAAAIGTDVKGIASLLIYCVGIGLSFVDRWFGIAAYVAVALMWFVPDRRVERALTAAHTSNGEAVGHARSRDGGQRPGPDADQSCATALTPPGHARSSRRPPEP
jgi:uncharacterized membrane protein